jgi:hypothetical protein
MAGSFFALTLEDRFLVSVMIGLIGPVDGYVQILALLGGEFGELDAELVDMKSGDLLV